MRHFSSVSRCRAVNSVKKSVHFFSCLLALTLLATVAALPATAQSEWQLYGGTSFLWDKTSSPYLAPLNLSTLNEWGWQTDITEYPWHWFGGTLESSGFYGRPSLYDPDNKQSYGNLFNVKTYTMMFGPTFAYKRYPDIQPFGHVLMGGINEQCSLIHAYDACQLFNGQTGGYSHWIFGWALGGGADIKLSRLVAIRGQFDWLPTTFKNRYNDRENNYRVSVGLVFRFGATEPKRAHLKPPAPSPAPSGDMSSNSTAGTPQPVAQQSSSSAQANPASSISPPVPQTTSSSNPHPPVAKAEPPVTSSAASPAPLTQTPVAPSRKDAVLAAPQVAAGASDLEPGGGSAQQAIVPPPAPVVPTPVAAIPAPAPATPMDPQAMPAPAPATPAPGQSVMVEFWSSPTGADILIDGQYVGSTFSIVPVAPGEHTITIRKQDFASWQRTIRLTSGSIRVAAYLERVRATITFH